MITSLYKKKVMVSLQRLCLNKIIKNFPKIHSVYSKSDDLHMKLCFEFLKRHSIEIILALKEKGAIKAKYIDFLINRHLKFIHTDWFEDLFKFQTIKRIRKKMIEIGPNLERVHFSDKENWYAETICHMPNLKFVCFHDCCDDILKCIVKFCPVIEHIDCFSYSAKDGFKHFGGKGNSEFQCPEIKTIRIFTSKFGDEQPIMDLIKYLPSLKKLDFIGLPRLIYSMHKDDINVLDQLKPYNLTEISLMRLANYPIFDDVFKICVSVCPHLKSLSCPVFTKEQLNLCSKLSELQYLHICDYSDSFLQLNHFLKRKNNLISLKIEKFLISFSVLGQTCPHLKALEMHKVRYQCTNNNSIPVLPNLNIIIFYKCDFDDSVSHREVASFLSSCPNMEQLFFINSKSFPLEIKAQILKCCEEGKLKNLDFSNSPVDLKYFCDILLASDSITNLNIAGCNKANNYEDSNKEVRMFKKIALTLPNRPHILMIETVRDSSEDVYYPYYPTYDDEDGSDSIDNSMDENDSIDNSMDENDSMDESDLMPDYENEYLMECDNSSKWEVSLYYNTRRFF